MNFTEPTHDRHKDLSSLCRRQAEHGYVGLFDLHRWREQVSFAIESDAIFANIFLIVSANSAYRTTRIDLRCSRKFWRKFSVIRATLKFMATLNPLTILLILLQLFISTLFRSLINVRRMLRKKLCCCCRKVRRTNRLGIKIISDKLSEGKNENCHEKLWILLF